MCLSFVRPLGGQVLIYRICKWSNNILYHKLLFNLQNLFFLQNLCWLKLQTNRQEEMADKKMWQRGSTWLPRNHLLHVLACVWDDPAVILSCRTCHSLGQRLTQGADTGGGHRGLTQGADTGGWHRGLTQETSSQMLRLLLKCVAVVESGCNINK